jgi:hypothetical protein
MAFSRPRFSIHKRQKRTSEGVPLAYKVEDKMRLSKDKTAARVNRNTMRNDRRFENRPRATTARNKERSPDAQNLGALAETPKIRAAPTTYIAPYHRANRRDGAAAWRTSLPSAAANRSPHGRPYAVFRRLIQPIQDRLHLKRFQVRPQR